MASGYVIPLDPAELASRFHTQQDPYEEEDEEKEDPYGDRDVIMLLEMIPKREADLILMYYVEGKRQAEIASIFGVTQAAVSYRLHKGLKRIKFLLSIPQVTKEELQRDLPRVFPSQKDGSNIDVDILVGMWETTCQSEVATRLNLTQGRVRHRFFQAVEELKKAARADEYFDRYYNVFYSISSKKFNILREVKLPQWADRGGDECA